jgi:hypothetical protein
MASCCIRYPIRQSDNDMKKIVEYRILWSTNTTSLEDLVKDALKCGWQPFGSPTIDMLQGERCALGYIQAMVKYEN